MLGKKVSTGAINMETSALVTCEANTGQKIDEKPPMYCNVCDKPYHTRETCWKIHGKPANWKSKQKGKFNRNPTAHETVVHPFNKEQVDYLLKLLISNSSSGTPNASLAQTGNNSKALTCRSKSLSVPWIIDSGASDHMTNCPQFFQTYSPCSGSEKVRIANGSYSSITGKGLVQLSNTISLKFVLHVPKLTCNLLSVSKLSKDSSFLFESHCEFQEQSWGKMIGSAKLIDGLYYFDNDVSSNKTTQGLISTQSNSTRRQIMLWHLRLGHPSFPYMNKLFPTLFKGLNCSSFYRDSCFLSKSHRTVYLPRPYQASKPFI